MKYKKLSVLAAALAVAMALSGCGRSDESVPAETTSPAPTAETTIMPTTTPGSVNEKDENTGDMTDPDNSVDAGDGSTSESRQENKGAPDNAGENSTRENADSARDNADSAMDDMKRAGEDLGDAAQDAGKAVEDGINMQ